MQIDSGSRPFYGEIAKRPCKTEPEIPMRHVYHAQLPLTSTNSHGRAAELCEMSAALDANLPVLRRVHADLLRQRKADAKQGREGMTAEQVVRAALVKQM